MNEVDKAVENDGIVVFSKPQCADCARTKEYLANNGHEFTEFDISENDDALSYITSRGIMRMPYVVANGDKWSGFSAARLKSL